MVEALGKKLGTGNTLLIEDEAGSSLPFSQSNVLSSSVVSFDSFRTIKKEILYACGGLRLRIERIVTA